MTHAKLLREHRELLLDNYTNILNTPFYRDCHLNLIFRSIKSGIQTITLGNLLGIWNENTICRDGQRIYLLGLRNTRHKSIEVIGVDNQDHTIKYTTSVEDFAHVFNYLMMNQTDGDFYIPLSCAIDELNNNNNYYSNKFQGAIESFNQRISVEAQKQEIVVNPQYIQLLQAGEQLYIRITGFEIKYIPSTTQEQSISQEQFALRFKADLIERIKDIGKKEGYDIEVTTSDEVIVYCKLSSLIGKSPYAVAIEIYKLLSENCKQ